MSTEYKRGCDYFSEAMEPELLVDIVKGVAKSIKKSKIDFEFIACTGASGCAVAPIVAFLLGKPLTIIRKEKNSTHAGDHVAGTSSGKYIIVDDFVASGSTVRTINGRLKPTWSSDNPFPALQAVFCYHYVYRGMDKNYKPDTHKDVDGISIPIYFRMKPKTAKK